MHKGATKYRKVEDAPEEEEEEFSLVNMDLAEALENEDYLPGPLLGLLSSHCLEDEEGKKVDPRVCFIDLCLQRVCFLYMCARKCYFLHSSS